jgi:PBP1b-binding outer membrane lipoprotein LpoB
MKHSYLLVVAAAFVLTACGKPDTPKSPAPTTGSTASPASPSTPATPAPKMEEKKDEMKK